MLPRVGLVGTQEQVGLLAPVLISLNFKITALYCKSGEFRDSLATKYNIPYAAKDFKDLLFRVDVDLVYVATEPGRQAEVAVKALTSGKHCICQKPPTLSQAEARKMVGLSQYYNKLLSMVDSHLRFLPAVQKLKKLLNEGYCGELLAMEAHIKMSSLIQDEPYSWKCESSMGGGALNIIGAHLIDLVTFLSGQHAVKAHATLNTFTPTTSTIRGYRTVTSDDFCGFHLRYDGGLFSTVTINTHGTGQYDFLFSVTGTQGTLSIHGLDLVGSQTGKNQEEVFHKQVEPNLEQYGMKVCTKYPKTQLSQLVLGYCEMLEALKKYFKHCSHLGSGSSTLSCEAPLNAATFEDGLYTRTVLDTLHTSHSSGRWLDVPKATDVDPSNPFWTSSSTSQLQHSMTSRSSPKATRPVYV